MSDQKINKHDLKKINKDLYEVPIGTRAGMRVPARLYADDALLEAALADKSVEQLANTAALPGIVGHALAMPDIHQGYGFPIGGVAATALPDGVISPGGVGYDINCGVRMLASSIEREQLMPLRDVLVDALARNVPTGLGRGGDVKVSRAEMDNVLADGARWAVRQGFGTADDLAATEENGGFRTANPAVVSARARERGNDQLGTLGSGNHFIEVQEVVEIYDAAAAEALGLRVGQITVLIHSGSRGLGHQVCTDYVQRLQRSMRQYGISVPDRELVCAPFSSPDGQDYWGAMQAAANYAWCNRQLLAHRVRQTFNEVLRGKVKDPDLRQVYDVAHNIAKVEEHLVGGRTMKVCVHRKGATRAFPAGSPDVPPAYRSVGQPVIIPGSMGTESYILVGQPGALQDTFGSTCHGAGRSLSRAAAKRTMRAEELVRDLARQGIHVRGASNAGLVEEAPDAYKDVNRVVDVVHRAGLARKVARLRPLGVIKG